MKTTKKIAISMRITEITAYNEIRDELAHDWYPLLANFGLTPIPLPNGLSDPLAWLKEVAPDGIIFSGGGDVPTGDAPENTFAAREKLRDNTERAAMTYALAKQKAILGVCRGMHFLNYYFGGQLIRSLKDYYPDSLQHVANTHQIYLTNSISKELNITTDTTNSFHNTALCAEQLAPDLTILATSSDGVIEAFEHLKLPVQGIQWHPERSNSCNTIDNYILNKFTSSIPE